MCRFDFNDHGLNHGGRGIGEEMSRFPELRANG